MLAGRVDGRRFLPERFRTWVWGRENNFCHPSETRFFFPKRIGRSSKLVTFGDAILVDFRLEKPFLSRHSCWVIGLEVVAAG